MSLTWPNANEVAKVYLWTLPPPNTPGHPGSFESIPWCATNMFCGGHAALADGRILIAGGTLVVGTQQGSFDANVFEPTASVGAQWSTVDAMTRGRWYPTATTLGDGRVLVCSGISGKAAYNNVKVSSSLLERHFSIESASS